MSRKKQIRFQDIKTMDFVFEPTMEMIREDSFPLKGKWREQLFRNDHPTVLELGCGKGEYTVTLGERFPEKNFIGVDIKGARIWYGANKIREGQRTNSAFIRSRIDFITAFFGANEIDEIWLTFSDPYPRKPQKRLTARPFIERYAHFLKPGAPIHLKTDHTPLFAFTLAQIEQHRYPLFLASQDLYGQLLPQLDTETQEILSIKTHYEQLFAQRGETIKYVKFGIDTPHLTTSHVPPFAKAPRSPSPTR